MGVGRLAGLDLGEKQLVLSTGAKRDALGSEQRERVASPILSISYLWRPLWRTWVSIDFWAEAGVFPAPGPQPARS